MKKAPPGIHPIYVSNFSLIFDLRLKTREIFLEI